MKKKRILIVDDTPSNVQILFEAIKCDEYTISMANSGEKAIEATEKIDFDLILLDIIMPGIGGLKTCKILKNGDKTKHIPVIFVTSSDDRVSEAEGLKYGAIDYIIKPIVPELVKIRVANHLELKSLRDELEAKVKEETQKRVAQQELLFRQSKLASMGEMMSAITHQWSQPLNTISIIAGFIEEDFRRKHKDEDGIERAQILRQSVKFMAETMQEFKNYFNPDTQKSRFSIKSNVDSVVMLIKEQFTLNKIEVSVNIADEITIFGNQNKFKQVILNLIANAKDAIASNRTTGGKIEISLKPHEDMVMIEICDNGGGIQDSLKERIFDNYFTTKGEKGTGIGLYLCKMIVEEGMGGKIKVGNRNGGCCFTVYLPKN